MADVAVRWNGLRGVSLFIRYIVKCTWAVEFHILQAVGCSFSDVTLVGRKMKKSRTLWKPQSLQTNSVAAQGANASTLRDKSVISE